MILYQRSSTLLTTLSDKSFFVAWAFWESWTCSVTCGQGREIRQRRCMSGSKCDGKSEERRTCNKQTCPSE